MINTPPNTNPGKQAIRCRGCGYDLRAHATGNRCPECGRSTYDAMLNATPVRMSIESDSGMPLVQLSFLLAVIPLSGLLVFSKLGGVLATFAIFGPLFHITGQWRFNRSPFRQCEETTSIGRIPLTAILELVVGAGALVIVFFLQGTVKSGPAWTVIAAAWPAFTATRCAAWCLASSRAMDAFGLAIARMIQLATAVILLPIGLIQLANTVLVISSAAQATTPPIPFWQNTPLVVSLLVGIPMFLLALLACLIAFDATRRLEGILHWEMADRAQKEKVRLQKTPVSDAPHRSEAELPPIPLVEDDEIR